MKTGEELSYIHRTTTSEAIELLPLSFSSPDRGKPNDPSQKRRGIPCAVILHSTSDNSASFILRVSPKRFLSETTA